MLTKKETLDTIKKTLNLYKTNVLDNIYAKTEYVDSKALPIILINDENKTGPALFPLLPEHNLVFIAGNAQIPDSTGAITTIYGLCYSDLQGDGSKLITEYRTGKAAKVNSNGVLESFEYIDMNVKSIVSNIKGGTINKVLAKNSDTDFDYKWVDMPSIETFKNYVDSTRVAYVKSETECVSIDTSTMKDSFVNNSYTYQQDAVSYLEEGIEYHVEVNGVRYRCLCINNIPGKDIVYETIHVQGDDFSLTIDNKVGYSNNQYNEDVTKSSVAIELSDTLLQNPPIIKVIKMDIQYMPTYLMPKDLGILNSLGMNRIGKIGTGSISLGYNNVANNDFSTALGVNTSATAPATLAHGGHCVASANYSHAEGYGTESSGMYSHSEGIMTLATGQGTHAEGSYTLASSQYQHVEGKFNVEDKANKYAHIVGNGTSKTARKNAHTLDWSGNAWFAGKVTQEGTPTDNKDLVNKKYVDDIKASIVVPTKTSELTNDSNFLTEHQSLTGLATEEYVQNAIASAGTGGSDVATDEEVKTTINTILGGDYIE